MRLRHSRWRGSHRGHVARSRAARALRSGDVSGSGRESDCGRSGETFEGTDERAHARPPDVDPLAPTDRNDPSFKRIGALASGMAFDRAFSATISVAASRLAFASARRRRLPGEERQREQTPAMRQPAGSGVRLDPWEVELAAAPARSSRRSAACTVSSTTGSATRTRGRRCRADAARCATPAC